LLGFIVYRIPSPGVLFGTTEDTFDTFYTMTFYITIQRPGIEGNEELGCRSTSNCRIIFRRNYSPRIFYLSPPVVYYESYTEVWFDPKSTMNVI